MLRRKAYENLLEWKKTKQNETLLIKGARQIGKTFLVRQFGQNEYKSFIEINFLKNPDFKAIFEGELTADEIYKRISAHIPSVKLINGSTQKIKVEAGTQSGSIITLRGKGLPMLNSYGNGNLYIKIGVWIPKRLSRDSKELAEAIRRNPDFVPNPNKEDKSFFDRIKDIFD